MDENLPHSAADLLKSAGHDVEEAVEEGLGGARDSQVLGACQQEGRVFVTLDKGLADIRTYRPADYAGIVLLRVRDQQTQSLLALLNRLLPALETGALRGALWIADETRIRIRQ
jgi:predicted nuclease of predicted toxin-antitoxin system